MKIYTSPYIYVISFDIPTNKIIASPPEHISDKNVLSSAVWSLTLTQSATLINFDFWFSVVTNAGPKTGKQDIFKVCPTHFSVAYIYLPGIPIYFLASSFLISLSNTIKCFPSLNRSAWNLPFKNSSWSTNFSYHFAIELAVGGFFFFRPFFSNLPETFNRLRWTIFQHTQRSGCLCCSPVAKLKLIHA